MKPLFRLADRLLALARRLDFIAPLALRLYLAPIFWDSGTRKLADIESTAAWFGNPDWGLGLPFPHLQAWMVALFEVAGAICLLLGLAVPWMAIPLTVILVVAIVTLHGPHGWLTIVGPTNGTSGLFANEHTRETVRHLERAKEILQQYGNYDWLTQTGSFVVLNNGMEMVVAYIAMLLALFFFGAGRYLSADYWIRH
ncbi:MAG: DoxX family protein, partial [Nitrospirae bacterium]